MWSSTSRAWPDGRISLSTARAATPATSWPNSSSIGFPPGSGNSSGISPWPRCSWLWGAVTAFFITLDNQERFYTFIAEDYAQGRGPSSSTSELKAGLYDEHDMSDGLATFAASLFTHNAKIGIMAFALGLAIGLPVFLLMFINGLVLGAFAALFHARGLSVDLWGWLLPHGITELGAVVICGGLGLALAQSLVFPGRATRLHNLARRGRVAGMVMVGAVLMFFVAGLIEGLFRQLVTDTGIRYVVAASTAVLWALYFGFVGRGRERRAALDDAAEGGR